MQRNTNVPEEFKSAQEWSILRPSVFSESFDLTRIEAPHASWRFKARKVLDHIGIEICWVFFLLLSIVFVAYRDNIIDGAVRGEYSLSLWDYCYFAFTGIFLLDLIAHLIVFGIKPLFKLRPEYKWELFLQVMNLGFTIYYAL